MGLVFISDIIRNWYSNLCLYELISKSPYLYNWIGLGLTAFIIIIILVYYRLKELEIDREI